MVHAQLRIVLVRDLASPLPGEVIDLTGSRFVIGRAASNDLCLDDPRISRQHTEIVWEGERCWIADCGSVNGTFVNGQRLQYAARQMLKDGDEIVVSRLLVLHFVDSAATVEETVPTQVRRGLTLDTRTEDVFIGLRRLDPPLARLPYRLLSALVAARGEIVPLDLLIEAVWPEAARDGITPAMLDSQVARLRDRLAALDDTHDYVERIRNRGLRFVQRPN